MALLPSPPHEADRHREEQQRQEDRRHPRPRRGERGQNLQSPLLHLDRRERHRADDDRAQGPRARPRLPRGLLELAEDRSARPDRRQADQGTDRQKRRQSDPQSRQRGGRAGDRNRLRPRGRADRARGAGGDARRQSGAGHPRGSRCRHPADRARPLLGADQGRDRARLRRARHALLPARQRRRRPPGHRPALGRDPDPRRLPRQPPLRLQLPLGRPRPEPDPGPDRRARDGAPRPRRQTLLGTVRQVRARRRQLRGPPRHRQILGEGGGRRGACRHLEPRHGQVGDGAQEHAQAADPLQHDRLQHRRLQPPRHHPRQRDADRRGPLHGRLHLLPAYRQHGLPGLAAGARAGLLAGPGQGVLRRRRPARRRAESDPGQKRDHRPPADLPDPGDPPGRARGAEEARLRTRRAPLPRHLQPADDHRVDPRRHRGRLGDLLRPRLGRRRPRLRRRSTPTPAPPTRRSRLCRRASSSISTASPGSSTRRPSRRAASRRRN